MVGKQSLKKFSSASHLASAEESKLFKVPLRYSHFRSFPGVEQGRMLQNELLNESQNISRAGILRDGLIYGRLSWQNHLAVRDVFCLKLILTHLETLPLNT